MPLTQTKTLRIVIVTQSDPFYIPLFFSTFFGELREHRNAIDVRGVIIQKPLGNKTVRGLAKRVVGLYGFWGTVRKTLELLRYKAGDRVHRFIRNVPPHSIAGIVESHGHQTLHYTNVNGEPFKQYLKDNEIDMVVSVSASQIFKEDLLDIPPLGCINLHNGELPKYKGMLPNFWQMYNGETHTTLTIHKMAPKLDEGSVIYTRKTPIAPDMTLDDLIKRTKENSARALIDLLVRVANGDVPQGSPPGQEGSAYYTFPNAEDVREFRRRGYRVL